MGRILSAIQRKIEEVGSQREFAKMFGVHESTVTLWKQGRNEAPYEVIEFALGDEIPDYKKCPVCSGTGVAAILETKGR